MSEEDMLLPATIRALPTHHLQEAVEQYTRAIWSSPDASGNSLDIGRQRVALANEWKRVQAAVVYEMSWLGDSEDRQLLVCSLVASRVFEAADRCLRNVGLEIPRELVCEIFTQTTPKTPVSSDPGCLPGRRDERI